MQVNRIACMGLGDAGIDDAVVEGARDAEIGGERVAVRDGDAVGRAVPAGVLVAEPVLDGGAPHT